MIINETKLSSVLNLQTSSNNKTESTNSTDGILEELNSTGTTSADTTVQDNSNVDIVEISQEGLSQLQSSVQAAGTSTTEDTSSTDSTKSSALTSTAPKTSTSSSSSTTSTAKLLSSLSESSTSSSSTSTANLSQYSISELKQMYIDNKITKAAYQTEIDKRNGASDSSDSNKESDSIDSANQ